LRFLFHLLDADPEVEARVDVTCSPLTGFEGGIGFEDEGGVGFEGGVSVDAVLIVVFVLLSFSTGDN